MKNNISSSDLFELVIAFFSMLQAKVENVQIDKEGISGTISWDDSDEIQPFLWNSYSSIDNIDDVKSLINYLTINQYIHGDKILISRTSLEKENFIPGLDPKRINKAIASLCAIRIGMVDDNEITDHFLVHF